jgi:adenylate cyclase
MGVEIERKFLVNTTLLPELTDGHTIKQGYIQTVGLNTVRVRVSDDKAFLTLKSSGTGTTRLEFEYSVPLEDAEQMLENLCKKPFIDKKRYLIEHEGHTWELDIFEGENKGLIVAEVELESEDEAFALPKWVKEEVTTDKRYANSNLIQNPYINW